MRGRHVIRILWSCDKDLAHKVYRCTSMVQPPSSLVGSFQYIFSVYWTNLYLFFMTLRVCLHEFCCLFLDIKLLFGFKPLGKGVILLQVFILAVFGDS